MAIVTCTIMKTFTFDVIRVYIDEDKSTEIVNTQISDGEKQSMIRKSYIESKEQYEELIRKKIKKISASKIPHSTLKRCNSF